MHALKTLDDTNPRNLVIVAQNGTLHQQTKRQVCSAVLIRECLQFRLVRFSDVPLLFSFALCFPRLQYTEPVAISAMASNGNWTEPTGGVFAKYQVSSFTPS